MVPMMRPHKGMNRYEKLHFLKKGLGPKRQPSCSSDAVWPAVFIQLYTMLSQILQYKRLEESIVGVEGIFDDVGSLYMAMRSVDGVHGSGIGSVM
eukprot:g40489.t1